MQVQRRTTTSEVAFAMASSILGLNLIGRLFGSARTVHCHVCTIVHAVPRRWGPFPAPHVSRTGLGPFHLFPVCRPGILVPLLAPLPLHN
jgi:hypothetical protein